MPARTSGSPDAIDVHAWYAMVARSFSADERTRPPPESAPGKNALAPHFFPPAKVARAHRGLHNIFAHSTIGKMQCNNFAMIPPRTQVQAYVRSPKSARVYSSKAQLRQSKEMGNRLR